MSDHPFWMGVAKAVAIAATVGLGASTVDALRTNARQDAEIEALKNLGDEMSDLTDALNDTRRDLARFKERLDYVEKDQNRE